MLRQEGAHRKHMAQTREAAQRQMAAIRAQDQQRYDAELAKMRAQLSRARDKYTSAQELLREELAEAAAAARACVSVARVAARHAEEAQRKAEGVVARVVEEHNARRAAAREAAWGADICVCLFRYCLFRYCCFWREGGGSPHTCATHTRRTHDLRTPT